MKEDTLRFQNHIMQPNMMKMAMNGTNTMKGLILGSEQKEILIPRIYL
jgi:hypothetical protein